MQPVVLEKKVNFDVRSFTLRQLFGSFCQKGFRYRVDNAKQDDGINFLENKTVGFDLDGKKSERYFEGNRF